MVEQDTLSIIDRINQLGIELEGKIDKTEHKLENDIQNLAMGMKEQLNMITQMAKEWERFKEKVETLENSRENQGKRIGQVETDVSKLREVQQTYQVARDAKKQALDELNKKDSEKSNWIRWIPGMITSVITILGVIIAIALSLK